MFPVFVQEKNGLGEVLNGTCALLDDLDEFVAECVASQRSGGVGGGLEKRIYESSNKLLLSCSRKWQT